MADSKLSNIQIAIIAGIILVVPFIIVLQLTKADIVIEFNEDFTNQCFFGENQCSYVEELGVIQLSENDDAWTILGENVFCTKTERTVAVPVSDPVGVISEETEVTCNNFAIFDKNEWDLVIISFEDLTTQAEKINTLTFTLR